MKYLIVYQAVHGSMIRELFKLGASADIISFGGGNPSSETFPL